MTLPSKTPLDQVPQIGDALMSILKDLISRELGAIIRKRVEERGGGVGDVPMLPYKRQTVSSRNKEGLQSGYRDLKRSGKMLDGLRVQVTSRGVEVSFADGESATKAYYTDLQTPWLTVTPRDIEELNQRILDLLPSMIK